MNLFTKLSAEKFRNLRRILFVIFLSILTNVIVYVTGGTKSAWIEFNFIIIFFAAYYWKIKGGLLTAFILGMILGPFMPLDVGHQIIQKYGDWIFRLLVYMSSGYVAGYTLKKNEEINQQIKEKDLISHLTGLYNTNKLFSDLNSMVENDEKFCLVFFNIVNLEEISKYVDYKIIEKVIHKGTTNIKSEFGKNELYSSNFNQYILVLKEYDEHNIMHMISKYIEKASSLMKIEGYVIKLVIKAGIVFNNVDESDATGIFNKSKIAADQGEIYESGVYIYDYVFDKERKLFYEISNSIQNGIDRNEFYIVYQPIINLKDNAISSLEVLVRWNRGDRQAVGPSTFVKIAEETGSIKKITMEVIEQLINQLVEWKKIGVKIKSSVNFTASELIDDSFAEWAKQIAFENNIDSSNLGIEITERVFSKDGKKLNVVLSELQSEGYSVSIDDFGTGYNTLKVLEDIKADIIKIDKCFIDNILKKDSRLLIKYIIDYAHENGLSVIAEGVEKKEQVMVLKELGCDNIQGYYFSKPLLADDFIEYYNSFDINEYIV